MVSPYKREGSRTMSEPASLMSAAARRRVACLSGRSSRSATTTWSTCPNFGAFPGASSKTRTRLIILHGPLPGLTIDEEVVTSLREASQAPVFLLGWDAGDPAGGHEGFEVVPPLVTAALDQAVASYRKLREENQAFILSKAAPGFQTFSEAAMVHLLHGASAVQIQEDEVLRGGRCSRRHVLRPGRLDRASAG